MIQRDLSSKDLECLHHRVQPQNLINYRPQVLHISNLCVRWSFGGADFGEDLGTKALKDFRVHGEEVDQNGQSSGSLRVNRGSE